MEPKGSSQKACKVSVSGLVLAWCLVLLLFGCGQRQMITVRHLNPNEAGALGKNEGIVFGRVIFVSHTEEGAEVSFRPLGLGLASVETGARAWQALKGEKTERTHPISGEVYMADVSWRAPWFESDGTFAWVLPAGSYRIDALGWGFVKVLFVSAPDPAKPGTEQVLPFPLWPGRPLECGFSVSPDVVFTVSGECGASYIGSLIIDVDAAMPKEHGVEVKKVNRVEIRDEYAEASALFRMRCSSFSGTVEKRLMTGDPDRPVPLVNRRCPTVPEMLLRETAAGILNALFLIPVPVGR